MKLINEKRLVDLFLQLVSISTPARAERPVADLLTEILEKLGITVEEDDAGSKINGSAGN